MVTDTFNISKTVCHISEQGNQMINIQCMTYSHDKLKYKGSLLYKTKQTTLDFLFFN